MALTPRQQARLDAYLASFTPDITSQMGDLRAIADDLDALHKQYAAALSAIGTARDRLAEVANAARQDPAPTDALEILLTAVDEIGHDIDEIFMDEMPRQDHNGSFPLEVARDAIVTTSDELADAARALDEHAGRIGRIA